MQNNIKQDADTKHGQQIKKKKKKQKKIKHK